MVHGMPERALGFVAGFDKPAMFLLKDLHPYLDDKYPKAHEVVRQLRDIVPHLQNAKKTLVWVSPVLRIPQELEKDVTVLGPIRVALHVSTTGTGEPLTQRCGVGLHALGAANDDVAFNHGIASALDIVDPAPTPMRLQ